MIRSYSPEEVAEAHLPAEWTDRVRWLKRRLASGEIPGKRISRGVWRMTDDDVETWLSTRDLSSAPTVVRLTTVTDVDVPVQIPRVGTGVSVIEGLSPRSRARVRRRE